MLANIGNREPVWDEDLLGLLSACHRRLREHLALAERLAVVTNAHHDDIRLAASRIRRYFAIALPLHVADEDESISPRLQRSGGPIASAIATMTEQHAGQAPLFEWLAILAGRIEATPTCLDEVRLHFSQTSSLLAPGVDAHIELEERVIFPALARLTRAEQDAIIAEMRARRE